MYRLTVRLLHAAGAISFRKPKQEAPTTEEAAPSLKPTKNPNAWRLYMPDWLLKRQELRAEASVGRGPELPQPLQPSVVSEEAEQQWRDDQDRKRREGLARFKADLAKIGLQTPPAPRAG